MQYHPDRLFYQVQIPGQTPFILDLESAFTNMLFPLKGKSAKLRANSQSMKFDPMNPFIIYSDVATVSAMLIPSGLLVMADNRPTVFQWYNEPTFVGKQPLYMFAVSRDPETPLRKIPRQINGLGFVEIALPGGGFEGVKHIDIHVTVPYGTPLFVKNPGQTNITSEDLL